MVADGAQDVLKYTGNPYFRNNQTQPGMLIGEFPVDKFPRRSDAVSRAIFMLTHPLPKEARPFSVTWLGRRHMIGCPDVSYTCRIRVMHETARTSNPGSRRTPVWLRQFH